VKVSLLIWNAQNRDLLAEALAGECHVLSRDSDPFSCQVDLLIVDGPALTTSDAAIRAMKRRAEPLFLPVLLIASRPDLSRTMPKLLEIVDDIISRPIFKQELQARVRALLHSRRLSLRLRESRLMYEREHVIAETFQDAALPHALPAVPGFEFDGIYEPADDDAQLGGDWYDAVLLNDGRIVVSIGDVAGFGLQAAVTMASVRQAIRAVAQIYADPVTMLDAADRTLKDERPGSIVTALVGVLDPIAQTITYCSAGHPPPAVRGGDGTVTHLHAQSLPLGLRVRGDGENRVTKLEPDSLLCFYTDGLSEVARDMDDAERRIDQVLTGDDVLGARSPARAIKEYVYRGRDHRDDVAVMTIRLRRVDERDGVYRWKLGSDAAPDVAAARRRVVQILRSWGANDDALFTCELIFGELIANVVDYAPGGFEVVLDGRGARPVLHVLDEGRGFTLVPRLPSDLLSERGRGLFLIWTLSEDFNVSVRSDGGAHARAVLPVDMRRERRKVPPRELAPMPVNGKTG
jgi:serine phosphatase RsbU (regulator of sigma subunit)/anti-sigma regulatory factor (Ser/Thr protein kinase)